MFKAIARMEDNHGKQWTVTIYDKYETLVDAERAARRFARNYDNCLWVQVLDA